MTHRTRGAVTWAATLAATALLALPLLSTAADKTPDKEPAATTDKPTKDTTAKSDKPAKESTIKPAQPKQSKPTGGVSAEESLATFKVAPGLKATIWATEPRLMKPTDMDIDSKGRIWVTEAANYRGSKVRPEGDRIMILEDTKHTGVCDSYKVFVQDPAIVAPLGICVLGNKVLVSQSPNMLIYTIDDSGDKPVGPPQVVFTGFGGNNHDHGLHTTVFGPDGRLYFNCGNAGYGGYVHFGNYLTQHDGKPVADITGTEIGSGSKMVHGHERKKNEGYREGMAFSMNMDGSDFEVLGYNFRNNYEVTVDSFGTVWQSDNDDDGNQGVRINYVMEGGNFGYTGPTGSSWARDTATFLGQTKQEAHWHQRWPGVVPNLLNTGQGSPTGITVYEGDLLPELYHGMLLHADPGPNVVRAYITRPGADHPTTIMKPVTVEQAEAFKKESSPTAGAGYEAVAVELIKATDKWFRPDDVCVAPDGALYITDWYDPGVGGHQTRDTGTVSNGNDYHLLHGRVFRLTPENYTPPAAAPKPDLETIPGQIAALDSPNFATRYLGYTKLAESLDKAPVIDALKQQLDTSKHARLRSRALWLLVRSKDGEAVVKSALKDKDINIRIAALRAARRIKLDVTQFASDVLADPSPMMWRELCLGIQHDESEKVLPLIVKLADKYDGNDRWYLEAFGIACNGREKAALEAWEKDHQNKDARNNEGIVWRLKMEPVPLGGAPATKPTAQTSTQGGARPFVNDNGVAAHDAAIGIEPLPAVVALPAADLGISGQSSIDALSFLNLNCEETAKTRRREDRREGNSEKKQVPFGSRGFFDSDAFTTLHKFFAFSFASSRLRDLPPLPETAAIQDDRLYAAAGDETPAAAPSATAPASKNPLPPKQFKTKDGKVLPSMEELAKLNGDAKAGAVIFRSAQTVNCIKCHQIGEEGNMIGPPLTVIGAKLSKPQFYEAILYPSAAIEMGYEAWVVRTKDGDIVSGLKAEDTPDHITIKDSDGKYHDIDRDKIDKMVKQPISLMPEELNEAITQQDLVNLVEYLTTLKP